MGIPKAVKIKLNIFISDTACFYDLLDDSQKFFPIDLDLRRLNRKTYSSK